MLKAIMTKESYLTLVTAALENLEDSGRVFAYDKAHFQSDPASLNRLEARLANYFKSLPPPTIILIGEHAVSEHAREIYFKNNGEKKKILLIGIDSQWKISRLPESAGKKSSSKAG